MSVREASFYSIATQVTSKILGFISIIILARLLTPEELGLYAISASIMFLAYEIRFLGTGKYIVREKFLNEDKLRSVLGVNVILSFFLGLISISVAKYLAVFFEKQEIEFLIYLHSATFFIVPFIVIPNALLTRNFHFKKLFYIEFISQFFGLVTTIYLVFNEWSYYSLAIGLIISSVTQLLILIFIKAEIFFIPRFVRIKQIISTGVIITTATSLSKLILIMPDLIIGKLGNVREVALFSKGIGALENLSHVILMSAHPIALPYLSNVNREGDGVKQAYIDASEIVNSFLLPFFLVMSVASYPIVMLLFGSQWIEVPQIVTYLSIWMFFRYMHPLAIELFFSSSYEKIFVVKETFALVLITIILFSQYESGLESIAKYFILVGILDLILTSFFIKKIIFLGLVEYYKSMSKVILVALICLLGTIVLSNLIDFKSENYFTNTLILFFINFALWFSSSFLLKLKVANELKSIILKGFSR